jgi:hypothetical protein
VGIPQVVNCRIVNTSQGQLDVLWEQIYCAGRIFRGEGRFREAKECFEHCLAASGVPELDCAKLVRKLGTGARQLRTSLTPLRSLE